MDTYLWLRTGTEAESLRPPFRNELTVAQSAYQDNGNNYYPILRTELDS